MHTSPAPDTLDYLRGLATQLGQLGPKGGRTALIASAAAFLGWSPQTVYRQLQQRCGWRAERKTRADKGTTSVCDRALTMLGATQREDIRDNGKQALFTTTARSVLENNGLEFGVSNAHLNRLMRARRLNVGAQRAGTAVQPMRALHPNYLHEVDPSLCLVYYLKGRQHIMRDRDFYKNKLENYAKIKLKVFRWVMYDRASGYIVPWYTEAMGEDQHSLFEFLMFAWSDQPGRPFHGPPLYLLWDKGSAQRAGTVRNLCAQLEITPLTHEAGHSRVKGGVEVANNILETQFESRLRFEPVSDVAELNRAGFAWANAYNANLIAGQDTRLRREGLVEPVSRLDLWLSGIAGHLRKLPPVDVCRALMASREESRKVRPDLSITFRHPQAQQSQSYPLRGLEGVNRGEQVLVRALAYGDHAIQIQVPRYDGEMLTYRVEPEQGYDVYGQLLSGAVPGQEYKSAPGTDVEHAARDMDAMAYPNQTQDEIKRARARKVAPFEGKLDAHSHLSKIAMPAYLPRTGDAIETPAHVEAVIPRLSAEAAMLRIVDAVRRSLTAEENSWLRRRYADGATESEVQTLIEQFSDDHSADQPIAAAGGLRLI